MKTKTKKQREIGSNATTWALMTSALILMLALIVLPIFRSLYLSLSKYKFSVNSAEFIDLENYVRLAGSRLFQKAMKNTIIFTPMTVIPSMAVGLGLAVPINRKGKGAGFIRTAYFYPAVMLMAVIANIWTFIYMTKSGLFNQPLIAMGLRPMGVLSSKNTVLPTMAVMYVWKEAGYLMVFFLSSTQDISNEAMEAAGVDGAGSWAMFRRITIPLLTPTFPSVPTIVFTDCLKLMDHVVIMTEGVPNNAGTPLLYCIYQRGFINLNYGVLSALTVIILRLLLVAPLSRFISQDKKIHYNQRRGPV